MKSYILGIAYVLILASIYPYSLKIDQAYPSGLGTNLFLIACVPLVVYIFKKVSKKEDFE